MSKNSTRSHCTTTWGYHDEHCCDIPDEEHEQWPTWHECSCGAEHDDEDVRT